MNPQLPGKVLGCLGLLLFLLGLCGPTVKAAGAGGVDQTFNPSIGSRVDEPVYAVVVQPDGRIIIGGSFTMVNGVARKNVARLNVDGTLDASFTPGNAATDSVNALALQPDGKILIGGTFILRLNPNGTLDNTFPAGAILPGNGAVYAIARQPDGHVIIGGNFTQVRGAGRQCIARLDANGALDQAFGGGASDAGPAVYAIALQTDGKIILGGIWIHYLGVMRPMIVRVDGQTGALDMTFNTGVLAAVHAIAIQPNGKIVIGGYMTNYIARLETNGAFDSSFNAGGAGADNAVLTMAQQGDGRILIGGAFSNYNATARTRIARINADGTLDPAFDPGTGANSEVDVVALQPNKRILIGGFFNTINNTTHVGLARFFGENQTHADFDGDGRADISTWNSANGNWVFISSLSGQTILAVVDWGRSILGDSAAPGDYDGDGYTDIAVFRKTEGNWYILKSSLGGNVPSVQNWGLNNDLPVPGDYDDDGRTDLAVWRPSEGNWYILKSNNGSPVNSVQNWGLGIGDNPDKPVVGDYDGDGRADLAVWRPTDGNWYIINSSTGAGTVRNWGTITDQPVPGDYDADGHTDIAIYRPSEGNWYILNSSTGAATLRNWGAASDIPVPADYDGDGRTDIAVFRPVESNWYIINSSDGTGSVQYRGGSKVVPVPSAYLPH